MSRAIYKVSTKKQHWTYDQGESSRFIGLKRYGEQQAPVLDSNSPYQCANQQLDRKFRCAIQHSSRCGVITLSVLVVDSVRCCVPQPGTVGAAICAHLLPF
jgi:hypothetical protein